jgi:hypothetical protein
MPGFTRDRLARRSDIDSEAAELEGDLVHTGDLVGFFGATPVDQPDTFTQTYSTAARTVPAATAVAVTLADGAGTNDGTAAAITDVATAKAAIQELNAALTAVIADNLALRKTQNALIDTLQELGLVA